MGRTRGRARKPGSNGASFRFRPGALGLGSLTAGLPEADLERAIVVEGLERGVSPLVLTQRLTERRQAMARRATVDSEGGMARSGPRISLMSTGLSFDLSVGLDRLIWDEFAKYESRIVAEFLSLPLFVRVNFADPYGPNSKKGGPKVGSDEWLENNKAYYLALRSKYYVGGFSDPAGTIFSKIQPATLLGKNVIGGLHAVFVERLNKVGGVLEGWSAGLSKRVAGDIGSIGGFVPRYIAGSTSLSNHALGLAIDIDPVNNPHIKEPPVIKVLNEVAADSGFDFGVHALASKDFTGLQRSDQIVELHRRSQEASDIVQAWLNEHLPRYARLKDDLAKAKRGQKDQLDLERRMRRDKTGKVGSDRNQSTTEHWDREAQILKELNGDPDMIKLQALEKHRSIREMGKWRDGGIQTLPLELAVALSTEPVGLRWGQEYHSHKDTMHFELNGGLKPDSKPRATDLSDLLGPAAVPWFLQPDKKKKR